MLVAKPEGNYRFVAGTGEAPFCGAVIADAGHEIVRAIFDRPLPWREGFLLIEKHLGALGRPRQALCGVELRCAEPYTPEGFRAFNAEYADVLTDWGLYSGGPGTGSTARTNIAPTLHPPAEQVIVAFAYTVPSLGGRPTFVVSGATGGRVEPSPDATRLRVANIVKTLSERMAEMGVGWDLTTEVIAYTPDDIEAALRDELLPRIGDAVRNGVRLVPGRAPVAGGEVEIGTHGVRQELRISVE
jgi:hypothetical protein